MLIGTDRFEKGRIVNDVGCRIRNQNLFSSSSLDQSAIDDKKNSETTERKEIYLAGLKHFEFVQCEIEIRCRRHHLYDQQQLITLTKITVFVNIFSQNADSISNVFGEIRPHPKLQDT